MIQPFSLLEWHPGLILGLELVYHFCARSGFVTVFLLLAVFLLSFFPLSLLGLLGLDIQRKSVQVHPFKLNPKQFVVLLLSLGCVRGAKIYIGGECSNLTIALMEI